MPYRGDMFIAFKDYF